MFLEKLIVFQKCYKTFCVKEFCNVTHIVFVVFPINENGFTTQDFSFGSKIVTENMWSSETLIFRSFYVKSSLISLLLSLGYSNW